LFKVVVGLVDKELSHIISHKVSLREGLDEDLDEGRDSTHLNFSQLFHC